MDIRELRIGNLIKSKRFNQFIPAVISEFNDFDDFVNWKPYNINEETLIQFGFNVVLNNVSKIYKKYVDDKTKRCFYVHLKNVGSNPMWEITYFQSSNSELSIIVQFAHQLQNFYHSVTGEFLSLP
jgi:hypothetical protein